MEYISRCSNIDFFLGFTDSLAYNVLLSSNGHQQTSDRLRYINSGNLTSLLESGREPVQSFIQSITGGGTARLDVPLSVAETVKAKFISHFGSTHCVGEILLVGKNKQNGLAELVLIEHTVKFITS